MPVVSCALAEAADGCAGGPTSTRTWDQPIIGGTLVNRNDYPREAFMEALLRYIEEDLAAD